MSHFDYFPRINYDVEGNGKFDTFTHLLKRVDIVPQIESTIFEFDFYTVKSGQSPEEVAERYYGDSSLYWVIFLANNVRDRYHDWVMPEQQFLTYLEDKYGDTLNDVHHYEIAQTSGDTTKKINIGTDNTDHPSATAVTNYEYELELDEKKRKIRLIKVEYIDQLVIEFEELMRS